MTMTDHRTTQADLMRLLHNVEGEARRSQIIGLTDRLILSNGVSSDRIPYRLHVLTATGIQAFTPADGNRGDIGRTAREAEHTLRIMWATLRAARKARQ